MLVVVHHGNVKRTLQPFFYVEALGRLDVLKVYAAEGGSNTLNCLAELLGVFLINFNIKHVNAAVNLEQQPLALHHGLAAHGADVAKAEHGRAVANHRYEISLCGILINVVRSFLDFKARKGNARRVSQTQVGLRTVRLCRFYFYFSGFTALVVFKCGFF